MFKIISLSFIILLACIFSFRLIYYYRLLNMSTDNTGSGVDVSLYIRIKNNLFRNNNIKQTEGKSYVMGNEKENYVYYSGRLWRVLTINDDKTITLVSNEPEVLFTYSVSNFSSSSLNKYLNDKNGYYYKTLFKPDTFLNTQEICTNEVTNFDDIKCSDTNKVVVGIISSSDYNMAGGDTSFINDYTNIWTSNKYDDNDVVYITEDGSLNHTTINHHYAIKTTICFNEKVLFTKGDGSYTNPYMVDEEVGNTLKEKNVGKYVMFSNQKWKIIEQNEFGTKMALDGFIDGEKKSFDEKSNKFNDDSALYKYLNVNYYRTLENNELLVSGPFYNGIYYQDLVYDYENIYSTSVEGKVGLLNITDLFTLEHQNTFTMTRSNNVSNNIYSIVSHYNLLADKISKSYNIRPVIYIDNQLNVIEGTGMSNDPYQLKINEENVEHD